MGAICKYGNQDMRQADGCVKMPIDLKDGRRLDPIPTVANQGSIRVESTL